MAINLNTNSSSLNALSQLQRSREGLNESLNRIATGRRINSASDDPSGMIIADALNAQARGMGQAIRNASDAVSIVQTADGALGQSAGIINGIRENAVRAVNGSHSAESRAAIQAEIGRSLSALDDIAQNTSFNGQKLLSGEFVGKAFQVGAGSGETLSLSIGSTEPSQLGDAELGSLSSIDVTTPEGAEAAIAIADAALQQVNSTRSDLGSSQNQLESTIGNLTTGRINALSAASTIADVDITEESINLSRMENLTKAKTFAVAQANAMNKNVLTILGISGEK
jgi:flagellin